MSERESPLSRQKRKIQSITGAEISRWIGVLDPSLEMLTPTEGDWSWVRPSSGMKTIWNCVHDCVLKLQLNYVKSISSYNAKCKTLSMLFINFRFLNFRGLTPWQRGTTEPHWGTSRLRTPFIVCFTFQVVFTTKSVRIVMYLTVRLRVAHLRFSTHHRCHTRVIHCGIWTRRITWLRSRGHGPHKHAFV